MTTNLGVRYICSRLQKHPKLQIIGEASDGLTAIQKAEELQPDLILLDLRLPTVNGISAVRRIRQLSPKSKILFASAERSWEIVKKALRVSGHGYLAKSDAESRTKLLFTIPHTN